MSSVSRMRLCDILCELIELGRERIQDVRQQLVYYRASVYKTETAALIDDRIDQLRLLSKLLNDDGLSETLRDYDAMRAVGSLGAAPGECSFSKRVTVLLASAGDRLERLDHQIGSRNASNDGDQSFAEVVRQHRTQLLALCRHGSRQWAFFQEL